MKFCNAKKSRDIEFEHRRTLPNDVAWKMVRKNVDFYENLMGGSKVMTKLMENDAKGYNKG